MTCGAAPPRPVWFAAPGATGASAGSSGTSCPRTGGCGPRRRARPGRPMSAATATSLQTSPDSGPDAQSGPLPFATSLAGAILAGMATATSPTFIGRTRELARLLELLEQAESGRPAVVLVAGEAGVGKTRLLAEL